MIDDKFKLDKLYQDYLDRTGQSELRMSPIQATETKRAWMGGFGQALVTFQQDIGGIEDESNAIDVMQDLKSQVMDYWQKESNKHN